ncbi:hypothetical protein BZM27_16215 [Paraburkholderia steynii]|uniref:Rieske domain-containing protein n=1 Tax=Paraburkholderia steynii TaxID=1245441 RepID=A0A4V2NH90_9BURK|nr:hypothetical protein BZM27_16215 [Paraburkholderia steynii]
MELLDAASRAIERNKETATMYPLNGPLEYPLNSWYVAAWSEELKVDKLLPRTIASVPIVLFRTEDGEAVALDERCPHRRYPLSKGSLEKGIVTCSYHGFSFDGKGRCVHVPSMGKPVTAQKTQAYRLRERWNWVWVWLGDPQLAESTPLPDHSYVYENDSEWRFDAGGLVTLKARHMLLHENILDLSHLTYLHKNTVGSPRIASTKLRMSDLPNGVELRREVLSDSMDGTVLGEAMGIEGPVDRIMTQQFIAPCLHVTGPVIKSAADGGADPGRIFGSFRVIHGIVPETPKTTHYFWGFSRNFRHDDGFTELLRKTIRAAVDEDVDAAEAIERLLDPDADPDADINSPADAAAIKGRRIMQILVDSEARSADR